MAGRKAVDHIELETFAVDSMLADKAVADSMLDKVAADNMLAVVEVVERMGLASVSWVVLLSEFLS